MLGKGDISLDVRHRGEPACALRTFALTRSRLTREGADALSPIITVERNFSMAIVRKSLTVSQNVPCGRRATYSPAI